MSGVNYRGPSRSEVLPPHFWCADDAAAQRRSVEDAPNVEAFLVSILRVSSPAAAADYVRELLKSAAPVIRRGIDEFIAGAVVIEPTIDELEAVTDLEQLPPQEMENVVIGGNGYWAQRARASGFGGSEVE
jgi:hypothetical protein